MVLRQASESQQSVLAQGTKPFTLLAVPTSNILVYPWASLVAQLLKNPPAMQEAWVRSLGWEDFPGEGKGFPLQYFGLENSMECIVHGVAESDTTERLSLYFSDF